MCGSLASGSRSTFESTSMDAGPSSSTLPMLRSGVRPNLRHLRGDRSAPSRKLGSARSRDREAKERSEVRGGTKAKSTSTRLGVRCPAVEELASPQQAPGSLHGEVWASILQNQGPEIFLEVEIIPGCAATVACPSCPDHSPEPPGPGRIIRNMLGWSLMEKNEVGCGVWLFRGPLQRGESFFFP